MEERVRMLEEVNSCIDVIVEGASNNNNTNVNSNDKVNRLDTHVIEEGYIIIDKGEDKIANNDISIGVPMPIPLPSMTMKSKSNRDLMPLDTSLPPLHTHSRNTSGELRDINDKLKSININISPNVFNDLLVSETSSIAGGGSSKHSVASGDDDDITVIDGDDDDPSSGSELYKKKDGNSPSLVDLDDLSSTATSLQLSTTETPTPHRRSLSDPFKKSKSENVSLSSSPALSLTGPPNKRIFSERLTSSPSYRSSSPSKIDRYGFLTEDSRYEVMSGNKNAHSKRARVVLENQRTEKWVEMLLNFEKFKKKHPNVLKRRIRKGIPESLRGRVWIELCGVNKLRKGGPKEGTTMYKDLLEEGMSLETEHTCEGGSIAKDLSRTFPTHLFFADESGYGQLLLQKVLVAYALHDKSIGYCQGMNYVAGLLLCYMQDEEAFWVLKSLMDNEVHMLRNVFNPGLDKVHVCLYQMRELLEIFLPKLSQHMNNETVDVACYATEWFVTIFTRSFPFDLVLRVWDVFIAEGWKIVFRVAIALMKVYEKDLLKGDMEEISDFLRQMPAHVDPDTIMSEAIKIPLRTKLLTKLENQYKDKIKGK